MNSNQNSVLIAGESWITLMQHLKGNDSFTTTSYGEGVKWVKAAIEEAGFFVEHLPNHDAGIKFPQTVEDLNKYAVVILSDIGSNTLLLHPETFHGHKALPNRLEVLKKYVADGGALVMAGGYFSFQGINGAYSELAGKKIFPDYESLPSKTFEEAFESVKNDELGARVIVLY